jgi:hypothetical protein
MNLAVTIASLLIGIGAILWCWGYYQKKRTRRGQELITTPGEKTTLFEHHLRAFQEANPGLPALPRHSPEYEGWFEESIKRLQLRTAGGTRTEHLNLIRQLGEYRAEHLKLIQTEKAIGHELGLAELEHQAKRRKLEAEIAEHDATLRRLKEQALPPKAIERRDPVEETIAKIRNQVRTEVGIRNAFEGLISEFPSDETYLRRECTKCIADLRERR